MDEEAFTKLRAALQDKAANLQTMKARSLRRFIPSH